MRFDRWLGEEFVRRIMAQRPRVAFLAHPGIDKLSHRFGQDSPRVLDAMRTVDHTVQALEAAFAREGRGDELEIWIVSDHGHADVPRHEDLAGTIATWGHSVRAHPWVGSGRDVAVMVSGNAMAHLYLELDRRHRAFWPALRDRWQPLLDQLLQLDAIDLAVLPMGDAQARIQSRTRGAADVIAAPDGSYSYQRRDGDPLGLGDDLLGLDAIAAWERTRDTDYPDVLVQACALSTAPRAGDIILSASPCWDLRTRYEPVLHVSGHGAMLREQMLVPFVSSRPMSATLRRTVDVFPTALATLGLPTPPGLDGVSAR
jgi:arylsulfatase A-like enzyme